MSGILIAAIMVAAQPAPETIDSAYTRLDACEEVDGRALINERCEGYAGWAVYVGASDHSAGAAFSDRGRDAQLSQNPIGHGAQFQSFSRVVEWRVRAGANGWTPFATIHRWTSGSQVYDEAAGRMTGEVEQRDNVLVVSALRETGAMGGCHVAYVDARSVTDANRVARAAADLDTGAFRCGYDEPVWIRASGAAALMARAGRAY